MKILLIIFLAFLSFSCTKREIIIKEYPISPREEKPLEVIIEAKKTDEIKPKEEIKHESPDLGGKEEIKEEINIIEEPKILEQTKVMIESPALQPPPPLPKTVEREELKEVRKKPVEKIILEDIHFDYDQASLKAEVKDQLKKHAARLKDNHDLKLLIEGHCDERGTAEYNLALGEKRAVVVKKYFISIGINADKINTISYGEEKPINMNHSEEAWAINRRAHFQVVD